MGAISIWHWLIVLIIPMIIWIPPVIVINEKAGKSGWWALLCLFPLFGPILAIWIVAFSRWPTVGTRL